MQLYIGNKNYSSWSLRPWLLMRHAGIDFEEIKLRLAFTEGSPFKQALAPVTPTGKVPVLVDDGFAVWETLAIVEYLADKFPELALWPVDRRARARARSLCAEMHGSFQALREHCSMNVEARLPAVGERLLREVPAVSRDLERIVGMWQQSLNESRGPFLFGAFTATDAYFAPVCLRMQSYALPVPPPLAGYVARILALPAMQDWCQAALVEHDFLIEDEPYRSRGSPTATADAP